MKRKEGIVVLACHTASALFMRNFHITGRRDLGSERIIRSYMFGIVLTLINDVNLGRRPAVSFKNDICTASDVDSGLFICVAYK